MGIAAYNRGTRAIQRQIDAEMRLIEFEIMERLNALTKFPDAGTPFGTIHFAFDETRRVWWALDAKKLWRGFGFYYGTLNEAIQRWRVTVVAYENGHWIGEPMPKPLL